MSWSDKLHISGQNEVILEQTKTINAANEAASAARIRAMNESSRADSANAAASRLEHENWRLRSALQQWGALVAERTQLLEEAQQEFREKSASWMLAFEAIKRLATDLAEQLSLPNDHVNKLYAAQVMKLTRECPDMADCDLAREAEAQKCC